MNPLKTIAKWILNQLWEKINLPAIYRELKSLGKKYGRRFFWAALIWELIEDVVFPFISYLCGVPELIPVFLILHFEPIVYPIFFWGFRTYDRIRGREPWEPDRTAQSTYWRALTKVFTYNLAVTGWLFAVTLNQKISTTAIIAFICLMFVFGFIHDRIWHDYNYGIKPDDSVEFKRSLAKTFTYALISGATLFPLFRITNGSIVAFIICQLTSISLYLILEGVWAKSGWGITPVIKTNE